MHSLRFRSFDLAFLNQFGYILDKLLLVNAVGYLGNDDAVMAVVALNLGLGTHDDASATCLVGIFHALQTIYVCTRGEVGSRNVVHQLIGGDVWIVDECTAAVNHFAQIVGRHIGGHTHGNTVASVDEQVWHLGRHHAWLGKGVVEVVSHYDGVLLKVIHDVLAHLREAALGVTHGSWRVAIDRTEVTLSVDELVAHVPLLSHTHQSPVDRAVAVWVVLTKHLAHHAGTLLVGIVAGVANAEHTVEYSAMHRLEAVAHIGKRTCNDNGHGVVDVRRLHLLFDVDFKDPVLIDSLVFVHFFYV